jgi:hypothetical protein
MINAIATRLVKVAAFGLIFSSALHTENFDLQAASTAELPPGD